MRALAAGVGACNDDAALFLYAPPDLPEGRHKYMIMPPDGDFGHLSAMALYLSANSGDAVIYVHESAMAVIGQPEHMPASTDEWPMADKAARRGVTIGRSIAGLELASGDGSVKVVIHFPAWDGVLAGTADVFQLLDLAGALHEREPVAAV